MNNSDFQMLNKTMKTNEYIGELLLSFPRKDTVLINHMESTMYNLIELIHYINVNTGRIKEKYLKDFVVKLSMLDYYVLVSYKKRYISKHQREVIGRFLSEIRKISYGVIRNENH